MTKKNYIYMTWLHQDDWEPNLIGILLCIIELFLLGGGQRGVPFRFSVKWGICFTTFWLEDLIKSLYYVNSLDGRKCDQGDTSKKLFSFFFGKCINKN